MEHRHRQNAAIVGFFRGIQIDVLRVFA